MILRDETQVADLTPVAITAPILICLLGGFRLFKRGQPVAIKSGCKTEALLSELALQCPQCVSRESLLERLWPDSSRELGGQSLNHVVYSLRKLLSDSLDGASPVVYTEGCYRLNLEAGVNVDVIWFDELVETGNQQVRLGNQATAATLYKRAVELYHGDLSASDVHAVVERERLRARYLTILARLSDYFYGEREYGECLRYTRQLLANDPCREDAYRLVMRCYTRRGERAQALREYLVCRDVLRAEFNAEPEAATTALFDQIRLDPDSVQ